MKNGKIFLTLILFFIIFVIFLLSCFFIFNVKKENEKESAPEGEDIILTEPSAKAPTIIIDAGHGGEDGGAIGKNGAYEKDINLTIAKKLKQALDARSLPCALTRSEDILLYDKTVDYEGRKKRLDLLARYEFACSYDYAIFISVHQNSFPKEQYDGFQVYYSPNDGSSRELALLLEKSVGELLPETRCRSSKEADSSIYLLDKLSCTAILIECGFISNEEECKRLCDEEYQNRLCDAIADALTEFTKLNL